MENMKDGSVPMPSPLPCKPNLLCRKICNFSGMLQAEGAAQTSTHTDQSHTNCVFFTVLAKIARANSPLTRIPFDTLYILLILHKAGSPLQCWELVFVSTTAFSRSTVFPPHREGSPRELEVTYHIIYPRSHLLLALCRGRRQRISP